MCVGESQWLLVVVIFGVAILVIALYSTPLCLCGPDLPEELLFSKALAHSETRSTGGQWEWQAEGGEWRPYQAAENALLEAASANEENNVVLTIQDRPYVVSLTRMLQLNRTSRNARPVRRVAPKAIPFVVAKKGTIDPRAEYFSEHPDALQSFTEKLLPLLFDIYLATASAGTVESDLWYRNSSLLLANGDAFPYLFSCFSFPSFSLSLFLFSPSHSLAFFPLFFLICFFGLILFPSWQWCAASSLRLC